MERSTLELQRTVQHLETEIGERQRAEQELQNVKDSLAQRVAEQSRNLSGIYELILIALLSFCELNIQRRWSS